MVYTIYIVTSSGVKALVAKKESLLLAVVAVAMKYMTEKSQVLNRKRNRTDDGVLALHYQFYFFTI